MTTLICDGNNMTMRAVHAMARTNLSADGVNTGPLMVFINSLSRHVCEEKPDRLVVCWDSGPSTFRVALHPDYKANRKQPPTEFEEQKRSTFVLVKEFLALAGVHQVERVGFEADDLIAWYCHERPPGERAVILSSDKDFLQLLETDEFDWDGDTEVRRGSVEQVRLSAGGADTDRWTALRVIEEYGCEPRHLTSAMALAGDTSDNVPGVPGFGMKTAIKNLAKVDWDLAAVDHPRVVEYADQVAMSYALVDLLEPRQDLSLDEIPQWRPTNPASVLWDSLVSFILRYRLNVVKDRLYSNTLWSP